MKWRVVVEQGHLDLPGFGRCPMQEQIVLEADSEKEARELAREQKGKRVVSADRVWEYAVTLRGRHDQRRRETFLVSAIDEKEAGRALASNLRACRFARVYSRKDREQSIVKIERKEPAPIA